MRPNFETLCLSRLGDFQGIEFFAVFFHVAQASSLLGDKQDAWVTYVLSRLRETIALAVLFLPEFSARVTCDRLAPQSPHYAVGVVADDDSPLARRSGWRDRVDR
jgi:hypothetical protein